MFASAQDDVLLVTLSWVRALASPQHVLLAVRGRAVSAWIILVDSALELPEQLYWQKLGVNYFLPKSALSSEWQMLFDWLSHSDHTVPIFQRSRGENEARSQFFLDNIEEGIVVCAKGLIVDVSDRWLELFRCKREQAIGQPVMGFTSPTAVPMATHLINERWSEIYESEMLRKDGTTFPAIVRGRDQIFNGGELRLTTILDISRQKKVEYALKLAKARAERANQAKSEFLSRMSHELRTPLNAILGFAQILEMDEQMSEAQHDSVVEILKAGHHLLDLINEVLDLASIESGKITLSLESVDIAELLLNCRQFVQPLAVTGQISLYVERITISDTGAGIPRERLRELFQPFSRLGADRGKIEGTGIGLLITRKLTEAMGGMIGVESELGQGTSFWIDLPLARAASAAGSTASALASTPRLSAPLTIRRQRTILYIDDNPANLKLASQILEKLRQIRLVTIYAPQMGIEFALTHQPDLIMLDINLPGMDGYQVLQVLQSHLQLRHVPVIAVSANAMPHDIERGITAGFAEYLTKPLDIGRFLASVDAHLPPVEESDEHDA